MKRLPDFRNRFIRLTDERLRRILEHPEMIGQEAAIEETLRDPAIVISSRSDQAVLLGYRFYSKTLVGDKWLCVVVKYQAENAFVSNCVSDRQDQARRACMATNIKVWFDPEADFLEVLFSDKPGYQRQTAQDDVMERVDEKGQLLGFSILHVSELAKNNRPLFSELAGEHNK